MLRISNIKLVSDESKDMLQMKVAKYLRIPVEHIEKLYIVKESIDARRQEVKKIYTVDIRVKGENKILRKKDPNVIVKPKDYYDFNQFGDQELEHRPVVVGFGPAGMFAALMLARYGYQPIVLERGTRVEQRVKDVDAFFNEGELNIESNVQFGEGGAGTFSDGKLTTRVKDIRGKEVIRELIKAGAPETIQYEATPHVGTDLLVGVVKNIRETIIELGGEIRFDTKVTNLVIDQEHIKGVQLENGEVIEANQVVMAIGHSARDTFIMLHDLNVAMEQKPFAIGVRVEHHQSMINQCQYHGAPIEQAAEYKLAHTTKNGRGVYTFCMCPGGMVVPASSEEGMQATNGMSNYAREMVNANSALIVQVSEADFKEKGPMGAIAFQRDLERRSFVLGGSNYQAPAQLIGDFLEGKASNGPRSVIPSYPLGVKWCDLSSLFSSEMVESLKEGLLAFEQKIPGFASGDGIMTAIESRTSSPLRLMRDESLQSTHLKGMYPSGEGAGYAGGITSAAMDGIKVAEMIMSQFKPLIDKQ